MKLNFLYTKNFIKKTKCISTNGKLEKKIRVFLNVLV